MTSYVLILFCHSYLRWVLVLLALLVIARGVAGAARMRPWQRPDERLHVALVAAVDTQFLLGVWLYLIASPISAAFFADPAAGIRQAELRFFGLEHPLGMLIAVALMHVGRTRSKKAPSAQQRHKRAWVWTVAALLVMAVSIPWPFMRNARPLLRGTGRAPAPALQPFCRGNLAPAPSGDELQAAAAGLRRTAAIALHLPPVQPPPCA